MQFFPVETGIKIISFSEKNRAINIIFSCRNWALNVVGARLPSCQFLTPMSPSGMFLYQNNWHQKLRIRINFSESGSDCKKTLFRKNSIFSFFVFVSLEEYFILMNPFMIMKFFLSWMFFNSWFMLQKKCTQHFFFLF